MAATFAGVTVVGLGLGYGAGRRNAITAYSDYRVSTLKMLRAGEQQRIFMPRPSLKIWQSEVQATMSYRIGWCGNERPRRLSYRGTISNGNSKLTADEPPDQVLIKSLNIKLRTDGITCTGTAICSDGTVRSISPWIQLKNIDIKSGRQEKEGENGLTSMFLSLHKTEMHSHNHRALNSNTAKIRTK